MEQAADGAMRRNLGVGGNHEMLIGGGAPKLVELTGRGRGRV
jgi:hypothetical protein